jgi:HlyD family secretion protein
MKTAIVFVAAAGLAAAACSHQGGPPGGMQMGGFSIPVSAAPITRGTMTQTFSVTGSVVPLLSASLSSVASGNVLAVNAQIGQRVGKGDLLVKIDDGPLRAQLQSAQASLEAARARLAQTHASSTGDVSSTDAGLEAARAANQTAQLTLRRDQVLLKEGYVAQSAVDEAYANAAAAQAQLRSAEVASQNAALSPNADSAARANMQNAQAEVDVAQSQVTLIDSQLAQTDVSSPFDGVVVARNVDPGALAAPGTTLMEVAQLNPVYVDVGISGEDLSHVKVGTPATITVNAVPGRVWHGVIKFLSTSAMPGSLTYKARIPIENADAALRGGMVADVAIEQAHKANVLLAPRAAVFQTDAGFSMFVIDAGKAKAVPVDIGMQNDQEMEVTGPGLKAGVEAILNHAVTLQPGMAVQVLPPQGPPAQKRPTK